MFCNINWQRRNKCKPGLHDVLQHIGIEQSLLPYGSAGKEVACNAGDLGLIPGLGRSPGEGKGYPLQYSGWPGEFHELYSPWVAKSRTFTSLYYNLIQE